MVALVTVVIQLRSTPNPNDRPIRITSSSWAPYVDPDLPGGGPVAELMTEVFQRAGYDPELDFTSWQLAEDRVTSGSSIAVFPLVASAERREKFLLSAPLTEFRYVLFYDRRRGAPELTSAAALRDVKVGGIAGYDYWEELDAAATQFVEFGTALQGFEALAAGEIDVLAEGLLSGRAMLADPSFSGDASEFDYVRGAQPWISSVQGLHLMVPRTETARGVLAAFDRELAELRGTDVYRRLMADVDGRAANTVRLEPAEGSALVQLRTRDGGPSILAPRGTLAEVLEWPGVFTGQEGPGSVAVLVKVKLINGPAQGRVAWVDAATLVLDGGS